MFSFDVVSQLLYFIVLTVGLVSLHTSQLRPENANVFVSLKLNHWGRPKTHLAKKKNTKALNYFKKEKKKKRKRDILKLTFCSTIPEIFREIICGQAKLNWIVCIPTVKFNTKRNKKGTGMVVLV